MSDLNDKDAARAALEQVWEELAVIVDEIKVRQEEARQNPSVLNDPRVSADNRWLTVFERELSEVQTVYESRAQVSVESLRAATEAGRKLLNIITQARERVAPAPAAYA